MRHYDPEVVRQRIRDILADSSSLQEERLFELCRTISYTCYEYGMLEVRCGVRKALGLDQVYAPYGS